MRIGECIKALRHAAGLMQFEFAEQLGISASMLSLVEAGKREPTISFLRQVASELEIPSAVLFASALAEGEPSSTPGSKELHSLAGSLFEATRHSLAAKRSFGASGR